MLARHRAPTRSLLTELLGLVVPVECAGCGQWDVPLCERCTALLTAVPTRCEPAAQGLELPAWSIGPYAGALRRIVVAWKTHRRPDIAPAVLASGRRAGRVLAASLTEGLTAGGGDRVDLVVVPAPSGWRRRLARRLVARDLADAVARGLAAALRDEDGHPIRRVLVVDILRRRGGRSHQAGLGARGRARNRSSGIVALAAVPEDAVVLLVDDVLTTGATLTACARALGTDTVSGAFVVAHTPASSLTPSTSAPTPPNGAAREAFVLPELPRSD